MASTEQNKAAGRFVAEARHELRMSQAELAAALTEDFGDGGIGQGAISGYERGTRTVPAAVVVAILRRLETPLRVSTASERSETERLRSLEAILATVAKVADLVDTLADAGTAPEAAKELARDIRASLGAASK